MSFEILFVCSGNTCRSPLAEVVLRDLAEQGGWNGFRVSSAGAFAESGGRASAGSQEVARAAGLDLEAFVTRRLDRDHVEEADLILVMEPSHRSAVLGLVPQADTKTRLLGELAGREGPAASVPDPFGESMKAYGQTFLRIRELVRESLEEIQSLARAKRAGSS